MRENSEGPEPTRNLELLVEYEGSAFAGWQVQPDQRTVAGEIERAAAEILRHPVHLVAASRTDAGVHALGQVANFETPSSMEPRRILPAINALAPPELAVRRVREVSSDFHARYHAKGKHYAYRIFSRPARSPLEATRTWHVPTPLDVEAMDEAAQHMVGEMDFSTLVTRTDEERGTVRRLRAVRVRREADRGAASQPRGEVIVVDVVGDSFLYKMVRTLAGTLVQVGRGKLSPAEVAAALASRSRTKAGPTAPPQGLTLIRVFYEERALAALAARLSKGSVNEHHGDGTRNNGPGRAQGVRRAEGKQVATLE